jgi:hypothetical protein
MGLHRAKGLHKHLSATFGYQALFSMIQTYRDLLKAQLNQA